MAAHPLLLDTTPTLQQSKKDRYKPMQPKFASIKANVRNQPSPQPTPSSSLMPSIAPSPAANPYMSAAAAAAAVGAAAAGGPGKGEVGTFDVAPPPRERVGKQFKFNQKGRYVALGNQMRQEIQLEQLKQRIAESARKAGLDGDLGVEKAIKVCQSCFLFLVQSLYSSTLLAAPTATRRRMVGRRPPPVKILQRPGQSRPIHHLIRNDPLSRVAYNDVHPTSHPHPRAGG